MTSTSPFKIGGNAIWGEWFSGLIDEVRLYNRALTLAEIQGDMTRAVTNPDACVAVGAGCVVGSGGLSSAVVVVGGGVGQCGCGALQRAPGYDGGVCAVVGEPGWAADGDEFHRLRVWRRAATSIGSRAEDAAGNVGPFSNEAAATVGDTQAPTAPADGWRRSGRSGGRRLSWAAVERQRRVCCRYNVHRGTSAGFTPSAANRIAQPTRPSYIDTTAPGLLLLQGHRRGRGRQHRPRLERGRRDRDCGHDRAERSRPGWPRA